MKKVKTQNHSQSNNLSIEKTNGYIVESRGGDKSNEYQPRLYHNQKAEGGTSFSAMCHIECGACK